MTNAIIYARFSPRRYADESQSNETQLEICREYCREQGYRVVFEFEDKNASGANTRRQGLNSALGELKRGWVLVTYASSRLSREFFDRESIFKKVEKRGAFVDLVSEGGRLLNGPDDKLKRRLLGVVDEHERERTAKRTSDAARQRQKGGQAMSKIPPYGFQEGPLVEVVKQGKVVQQRTWVPCDYEQGVIRRIVSMRESGMGLREIARELDALGYPARGKKWMHTAVGRIIKREKQLCVTK